MDLQQLKDHVNKSIINAYGNISSLSEGVLNLEGMSGKKTRHLYNNMCKLENSTYLEIGTWKGSTFISSLYKNNIHAFCVDNWSQFNGPKDIFYENLKSHLSETQLTNIKVINKDSWAVTREDIDRSIDIYMYDGEHTYESQKKAITYFHQFFSKYVIIMIDDWTCDWVDVKRGTLDGINEMKLIVHLSCEIPLVNTHNHHCGGDTFWNGCGIFLCERTDI